MPLTDAQSPGGRFGSTRNWHAWSPMSHVTMQAPMSHATMDDEQRPLGPKRLLIYG